MMTHYDSIVKRISEKNGEQIPEVGSDTFAPKRAFDFFSEYCSELNSASDKAKNSVKEI